MYKSANINGLMAAYDEMVKQAGPIGTAVRWGKKLLGIGQDAAPAVKKVVNSAPQASLSPGNFSHSNYGSNYAIKKLKDGRVVGFDQRSVDAFNRGEIGFNPDGTVWRRPAASSPYQPVINKQTGRADYINMNGRYPDSTQASENARVIARPHPNGGMIYSSPQDYQNAQRVEQFVRNGR